MKTSNLKRRHNTYYAVWHVPRSQQQVVGKDKLLLSLKTSNLSEAIARKLEALRVLQARVDAAVSGSPERLAVAEALRFRPHLLRAPDAHDPNYQGDTDKDQALDHLREVVAGDVDPAVRERALKVATGNAVFLKDLMPTFLKEQDHLTEKTRREYGSAIEEMLEWQGVDATEQELTRKRAGDYIGHLKGSGAAGATIQRKVSALSSFWAWMMQRGHIDNNPALNPWKGQGVAKKSKRAVEQTRRRWRDDELLMILRAKFEASEYAYMLPDLIRLALLTGARLDEICEWKAQHIERDSFGVWINNTAGKSAAAKRRIPVHPALVALVERLAASPDKEGYLLHDVPRGGYNKSRSFYVSKAFARQIDNLGLTDPGLVFHSLRATFIGHMEKAHVPVGVVKMIVGHERGDLTYGHYSKGDLVDLQAAIAELHYSPEVMALLAA